MYTCARPPVSIVQLSARPLQPSPWRKARIADGGNGGAQVFTVTHPFHPLRGQSFDLLAVRNNWGGDRVSYVDAQGRLRTLPIEWTDVQTPAAIRKKAIAIFTLAQYVTAEIMTAGQCSIIAQAIAGHRNILV